jgi:hypothetical protein
LFDRQLGHRVTLPAVVKIRPRTHDPPPDCGGIVDGGLAIGTGNPADPVALGNLNSGTVIVRRIDPSGIVTTVAGTGHPGYTGDGGSALAADLGDSPVYLVAGPAGSLYLATNSPSTVRKLTPIP